MNSLSWLWLTTSPGAAPSQLLWMHDAQSADSWQGICAYLVGTHKVLTCHITGTRFVWLRPLDSAKAVEVMAALIRIFVDFGCPSILHTDNGPEFKNNLMKVLRLIWPNMHHIFGSPRHPQSQGCVERVNKECAKAIAVWIEVPYILKHTLYPQSTDKLTCTGTQLTGHSCSYHGSTSCPE